MNSMDLFFKYLQNPTSKEVVRQIEEQATKRGEDVSKQREQHSMLPIQGRA